MKDLKLAGVPRRRSSGRRATDENPSTLPLNSDFLVRLLLPFVPRLDCVALVAEVEELMVEFRRVPICD